MSDLVRNPEDQISHVMAHVAVPSGLCRTRSETQIMGFPRCLKLMSTLRKHAHVIYRFSRVLKLKVFSRNKNDIFLIFAQNIECGYMLEPPQRCLTEAVLMSTHNLCYRAKIRKIRISL